MSTLADTTLSMFHRSGAYLRGHFRLTSGLHSPEYLQCALVLQYPQFAERLGADLARQLQALAPSKRITLVAAPAMGGIVIGYEVARALGARFLFTERDPASRRMLLRRGQSAGAGEVAVVVEDVITTGGSTREVIEILLDSSVEVVAAGSVIDRSGGRADLGVPRTALATLNVVTFAEDSCPMCKQGLPVQKPGSR